MNHALQHEEEVELWHVEVAPNDVRVLTLEQLDEAFQQGLVNGKTRVFQDGMDEPAFLGELLGLDDESDDESTHQHVAPAAPSPQQPQRHHQNTLVGLSAEPPRAPAPARVGQPAREMPPHQSQVRPVVHHQAPPPGVYTRPPVPAGASQPPHAVRPAQQPRRAPVQESAWPPVVARPATPAAVPGPQARPSQAPAVNVAPSVVPMAMDLGDVDDFDYPRPKSKGKFVLVGAGVLAVAAGVALAVTGQGAQLLGSLNGGSAAAAAAPAKPKPVVDTQSHGLDTGSAPVKLKEAPPPVVITTRENEAQQLAAAGMTTTTAAAASDANATTAKSALTKPSKKGAAISAKHAKSGGSAPARHGGGGGGGSKGPFKAGGDTHDPLNGSL